MAPAHHPHRQNSFSAEPRQRRAYRNIDRRLRIGEAIAVSPLCALNALSGRAQPYVNPVDNGTYLLNVSVNNVPLTQLSTTRPRTAVFLSAGLNVISAANGSVSTDYFVRNGGDGSCTLP